VKVGERNVDGDFDVIKKPEHHNPKPTEKKIISKTETTPAAAKTKTLEPSEIDKILSKIKVGDIVVDNGVQYKIKELPSIKNKDKYVFVFVRK